MERISSVDADVSSSAVACRDAPSASDSLDFETCPAATDTRSALSDTCADSRFNESLALWTCTNPPAPTRNAISVSPIARFRVRTALPVQPAEAAARSRSWRATRSADCLRSEEHTSELQSHSFISYAV